ncbi:MAG: phage virion morphogenesis protein [Verrucomicrobiaceae bacterium]|nr:phage virion morphogenesis protein [Verrucomicrobiaceae bacterium]
MPADAIAIQLKLDEISPSLAALADDALKKRILLAMGTVIESTAVRAFDEPSLRPAAWPARKKSKASNPLLIKSGNLRQSIHTQVQGSDAVKIGSPVIYGAAHQLGSTKRGIPARPFFPVVGDQLTGHVQAEIKDVVDALIGKAGGG